MYCLVPSWIRANKTMPIDNPELFMREAIVEAKKAAALGEVPVGAVLVVDGEVVARAHNRVETEGDATQHAELLVLRESPKRKANWRLDNATLLVTLEPCTMCLGAILLSRVKEVYFGAEDPEQGACGSVFDVSQHPGLPHSTEVYSGVLQQECSDLLKEFFRNRRVSG